MSINLLENLGIDPEQIKTIGQAGIKVITAESNSNRCSLDGSAVKKIELATNNGTIRDEESCRRMIEYAIKTNSL